MSHNLMAYAATSPDYVAEQLTVLYPKASPAELKGRAQAFIHAFHWRWEPGETMPWENACNVGEAFEHALQWRGRCAKKRAKKACATCDKIIKLGVSDA